MPLRLGTRASALAQWQANWVASRLRERGVDVVLVPITTAGDQQQGALRAIGGQGLFTKEIQRALLDDRIDLAVHSLKDLPTATTTELCLAAVPERAPPSDVLVSPRCQSFQALPSHAKVGTGSLRRQAQLLHARPDLQMIDVRGNVETRLRKVEQGDFDAVILAEAGLRRLGLEQHIVQVLPFSLMLPAIGQGALGLETRTNDQITREIVSALDHPATHAAVLAERTMLAVLQGGCLAPIAALAYVSPLPLGEGRGEGLPNAVALTPSPSSKGRGEQRLTLAGRVIGCDGSQLLEARETAAVSDADELGRQVAEMLLAQGAGELVDAARRAS